MLSAICFNLDQSKILSSGNELRCSFTMMQVVPKIDLIFMELKQGMSLVYYQTAKFSTGPN